LEACARQDDYEHCAESLCGFPPDQRWALADSALLQAIAADQPVQRGTRGRRLRNLLLWTDRLSLAGMVVLAVGFADLLTKLWQQGIPAEAERPMVRVFVGFGAGAEEAMFDRYRAESRDAVFRTNQVDTRSWSRLHRVGFKRAMRAFWRAHKTSLGAVRELPQAVASRRIDFLTHAAMRLGEYSYVRAWFESLRDSGTRLTEVCFLAADTSAFAASDAGMATRYIQHGFVRRSLLWPEFRVVDALTHDEACHFRRILPKARVRLVANTAFDVAELTKGVLVASVYEQLDEMRRITPFLEWARANGWPVWVRPHPREERAFWKSHTQVDAASIQDRDASFHEAVRRLRPRFVVSWYSTALADALDCGVAPVTISDETTPAIRDMVYPLLDRALRWPRDRDLIERAMHDDATYRSCLERLRPVQPHAFA
jgi:hypothetical protein